MQILTTRYNLKIHKLTFYGITRPPVYKNIETNFWGNNFK